MRSHSLCLPCDVLIVRESAFGIFQSHLYGRGAELFESCVKTIWNNTYSSEHGHEIGIAVPAGNNVAVEMVGHASPGAAADVGANVQALGIEGVSDDGSGFEGQLA